MFLVCYLHTFLQDVIEFTVFFLRASLIDILLTRTKGLYGRAIHSLNF